MQEFVNLDSGITLLLASKSPRRRELLSQLGLPMHVVDIDVDEHLDSPTTAPLVAEATAQKKSWAYQESLLPNQVLVTSDTVVIHDGQLLGKPHSREEALAMLSLLSGDCHQVYSGVCLRMADKWRAFSECTNVHFRTLTEREMEYYIDTYRPYDKAGSYGIQEWIGMVAVERIEGCYYNVMGLPVARLYKELKLLVD